MEAEDQKQVTQEELTREEQLALEEKAIEALLSMGVKFSVPLKIETRKAPWHIRWWNKYFPNHVKVWRDSRIPKSWDVTLEEIPNVDQQRMSQVYLRHFHVKPLYLGTIDALRRLYIQIEYDEQTIQDEPIQESKRLFKYISVMAEIAAVAVLNCSQVSDPLFKEVKPLKQFFVNHLTVQRLQKLTAVINQMMNAGGFTASIRSIREIGTTKPKADLVEKN